MLFTYIIVRGTFSLRDNKSLLSPSFNNILEERVKECFLKGDLDGKGVMNLMNYWREGSRFLEIGIIKFTLRLPIKMPPFHFFMTSIIY